MSQAVDDRTAYLLRQYITGTCTYEEYQELLALLKVQTDTTQLEALLLEEVRNSGHHSAEQEVDWEQMLQTILQQQPGKPARVIRMAVLKRVAVAAVLLICLGTITWWWLQKGHSGTTTTPTVATTDIKPGKNGAILTLANGRQVVLDSAQNGALTTQPGLHIVKHDSLIAYALPANGGKEAAVYNTLTTPRGRQFQVLLSDGTKVWLNASSSIHYPAVFNEKERIVEVTGEAYFEVAKKAAHPFIVNIVSGVDGTSKGRVEVLGTHFNINAYDDEDKVHTTLLEGRVKIGNRQSAIGNNSFVILTPGQQAVFTADSRLTIHDKADVNLNAIMAWKNGYFQFERADIQTVMRQIARWYDVDIQYEGAVTKDTFGGNIPRDASLSQVLHALEQSLVHFTIQGKKVIVTP